MSKLSIRDKEITHGISLGILWELVYRHIYSKRKLGWLRERKSLSAAVSRHIKQFSHGWTGYKNTSIAVHNAYSTPESYSHLIMPFPSVKHVSESIETVVRHFWITVRHPDVLPSSSELRELFVNRDIFPCIGPCQQRAQVLVAKKVHLEKKSQSVRHLQSSVRQFDWNLKCAA